MTSHRYTLPRECLLTLDALNSSQKKPRHVQSLPIAGPSNRMVKPGLRTSASAQSSKAKAKPRPKGLVQPQTVKSEPKPSLRIPSESEEEYDSAWDLDKGSSVSRVQQLFVILA